MQQLKNVVEYKTPQTQSFFVNLPTNAQLTAKQCAKLANEIKRKEKAAYYKRLAVREA